MGKNAHGSFANSIRVAYLMGANAIQFNFSPPSSAAAGKPFSAAEVAEINRLKHEHNIYLVCHGKYLYNFCRSAEWQTKALICELENVALIGCDVVIHQGKNVGELKLTRSDALKTFVKEISKVIDATPHLNNRILLENSCQQGTECGFTLAELSEIWNMFSVGHQTRLGICIDLCHIFVAGTLDVRKKECVRDFFVEFDKLIGLSNLKLIHFNDSNVEFDGHNDNHHDILAGYIGNPKLGGSSAGFKEVVAQCTRLKIPMILETPGGIPYQDTIRLMRIWATEDSDSNSESSKLGLPCPHDGAASGKTKLGKPRIMIKLKEKPEA